MSDERVIHAYRHGESIADIAARHGVCGRTVHRWLVAAGEPLRISRTRPSARPPHTVENERPNVILDPVVNPDTLTLAEWRQCRGAA